MMETFDTPFSRSLTDLYFIYRKKNNLTEFLHENTTEFANYTAEKRFKTLNMILIAASPNILPWAPAFAQVSCLIRMALRRDVPLFCESSAMHALVCAASVGPERMLVFNNKGKGGSLEDIYHIDPEEAAQLKNFHFFLDTATGDLYRRSQEWRLWIPHRNVGMHNIREAFKPSTQGHMVCPPPVHQCDAMISQQREFGPFKGLQLPDRRFEDVLKVEISERNHWLAEGLPLRFVIPSHKKWQVNATVRRPLRIIGSSPSGPEVVITGPLVGVQFHITNKYPETRKIFNNFIRKIVGSVQGGDLHLIGSSLWAIQEIGGSPKRERGGAGRSTSVRLPSARTGAACPCVSKKNISDPEEDAHAAAEPLRTARLIATNAPKAARTVDPGIIGRGAHREATDTSGARALEKAREELPEWIEGELAAATGGLSQSFDHRGVTGGRGGRGGGRGEEGRWSDAGSVYSSGQNAFGGPLVPLDKGSIKRMLHPDVQWDPPARDRAAVQRIPTYSPWKSVKGKLDTAIPDRPIVPDDIGPKAKREVLEVLQQKYAVPPAFRQALEWAERKIHAALRDSHAASDARTTNDGGEETHTGPLSVSGMPLLSNRVRFGAKDSVCLTDRGRKGSGGLGMPVGSATRPRTSQSSRALDARRSYCPIQWIGERRTLAKGCHLEDLQVANYVTGDPTTQKPPFRLEKKSAFLDGAWKATPSGRGVEQFNVDPSRATVDYNVRASPTGGR
uniref:Uncharacterized protein n=1 Tax=Chromera velia CCMP2878 TaxID=1169474 RepID=A0A0G4G646_9ALVE|eukprot:Cvel_20404.t1-p1 / transcript=Cvel_20404.t1 / gene=Cvel_20404 / organism=Chromera_velia_CCMP2878 / gene_product=hypothetical protein / transcript_product=hypothetical protein / location=Cvel_scaffold1827:26911-33850(+) / protein_length=732 / sequence_SO=supercontig / SO=protein_coding / is_pseudo=false